jgi:hypothetical protein
MLKILVEMKKRNSDMLDLIIKGLENPEIRMILREVQRIKLPDHLLHEGNK